MSRNMTTDELDLGPLRDIVLTMPVTDIAVTCDGRVWIDCGEGMSEWNPRIPLDDPRVVRAYAVNLCSQLGRRLDEACPIADASTTGGIRVHAVIAPVVPFGASISIRFPSLQAPRLEYLGALGMFPGVWGRMLASLVKRRATILITGGTGVGKTTLLRSLLDECPGEERIVSVEEIRELGEIRSCNHVSLVTREPNVEGEGAIGLPELVKATLRMRPDRVVLGECRGEEIADLLRALNSGHHGGMVTVHADSVQRLPARLIALGMLAGMSPKALAMLVEGAFDVVLHIVRHAGRRHIAQIGHLEVNDAGVLHGGMLAAWDGEGKIVQGRGWNSFEKRWSEA